MDTRVDWVLFQAGRQMAPVRSPDAAATLRQLRPATNALQKPGINSQVCLLGPLQRFRAGVGILQRSECGCICQQFQVDPIDIVSVFSRT